MHTMAIASLFSMYVPWPGHFPQPETPSGAPHQRPAYLIYDILGNYDD